MGWLLAALFGGYFWLNSQATPQKAAELAEQSLQKQYPGAKIDVEIEGKKGKDVINGRFKSVRVKMANLKMNDLPFSAGTAEKVGRANLIDIEMANFTWDDLPVDSALFHFEGVEYDFEAMKKSADLKIVRCGPSTAKIRINELALQRLVGGKLKDVPNARLLLENGQLRIIGEKDLFGVSVPFEMLAQPAGNGSAVVLEKPKVNVGGLPLPGLAVDALMKDVNPVYVFDRNNTWPFRVELTSVTAQNGILEINGNLPFKTVSTTPK